MKVEVLKLRTMTDFTEIGVFLKKKANSKELSWP